MRILIVDDNIGLAENIAEILEGEGYATEIAASAEEALPKARAGSFGVLVTDFRLPGLTGIDLIRLLGQDGKYPTAVVISAYADDGTVGAAQAVGARFLGKPIDFVSLSGFLRAVTVPS